MLLQKKPEGYNKMQVSKYAEMTQFLTNINMNNNTIEIEYVGSENASPKCNTLSVPLRPDTKKLRLEPIDIDMYGSKCTGYKMPSEFNTWFSQRFGYEVVLAYLGDSLRDVLFPDLRKQSFLSKVVSSVIGKPNDHRITFADCSPYLITSKTSLADVSSRLPPDEPMDMTKFRPNIVVSGAEKAYEEDFWARIDLNGIDIQLAHNCVRCASLNVDYKTGKPGKGESGKILAKLQKDRRVDAGHKWSPVFGRYCFWRSSVPSKMLSVGDEVRVTRVNRERTKFSKPSWVVWKCTTKC